VFPTSPTSTSATISATTAVTTSVTILAGDVLEAHVTVSAGTDTGMSLSATANGVTADGSTAAVHSNGQTAGFEQVFYWLTPSAGTYNVVATLTGGTPDAMGQKCYAIDGSNNSAPTNSTFAPSGTGNNTAASITSPTMPAGSVGISHFCAGSSFSSTGQTTRLNDSIGGASGATAMAGASTAGAGSTVSFTATISIADWYAAIVTVWAQAGGALDSGPNYAGAASDLGGGSGSWTNPTNAQGAADTTYAVWTSP
jgi:hypothetical protein